MSTKPLITDHEGHIARLDAQIAEFEAARGTDQEPPVIDALLANLRSRRKWHEARLHPPVPNTGKASLFEKGGQSQRKHSARRRPRLDTPVIPPEQLTAGA